MDSDSQITALLAGDLDDPRMAERLLPLVYEQLRGLARGLMKRVFRVDVLRCPHCSGRRRVLAFVMQADVVARILAHLGLETTPPEIARPRAPPQGSIFA